MVLQATLEECLTNFSITGNSTILEFIKCPKPTKYFK